jgi:transposase, IS5 family
VRDRSRAIGRKLRAINRTIRRRCGEAKEEVLTLTAVTGKLLERLVKEARRLAALAAAGSWTRRQGEKGKLKAAAAMEEMADRCEKVVRQIRQRVAGKPIKDRIVSLHDPDARPIRKGSWASRRNLAS